MRDIKFRAWDEKTSRIYQVNHFYNLSNSNEICVWTNEIEGGYHFNQSSLEQYTGLHDKNGKEIYEGDIVRIKTSRFTRQSKIKHYFVNLDVNYSEYSEWLIGNRLLSRDFDRCEVIGNVHENPELLEEK